MKVFAAACERNRRTNQEVGDVITLDDDGLVCTDDELLACAITLMRNLVVYSESPDVEVKERAFTSRQLLLAVGIPPDVGLPTATVDPSSIASKCRAASSMLTFLLTPEPMKPISAKAQQRKLLEGPPSPLSVEEWDRGVDWDVFPFLTEETPWFDERGNVRGSVESISFTRQQTSNANTSRGTTDDGPFGGCAEAESFGGAAIGNATLDSAMSTRTNVPPSSTQKLADPFYLSASSTPTGRLLDTSGGAGIGDVAKDAADAAAVTRFGSIRLDSEGESDDGYDGAKSKKKKKKKKADKVMVSKHHKIVESDDEDDDINVLRPKRGGLSKEIHNLALVDLTTPLGEDDVMPRNEHYVVPERPVAEAKSSPKKSKKKKDKISKKKKSHYEPASLEGDLLGFDSMAFKSTTTPVARAVVMPSSSNNPMNDAFDDLCFLGLNMPQLVDSSGAVAQTGDEVKLAAPIKEKKQKKDKQRKKSKKKE
jgi:AP-3 complex subunit delta-1